MQVKPAEHKKARCYNEREPGDNTVNQGPSNMLVDGSKTPRPRACHARRVRRQDSEDLSSKRRTDEDPASQGSQGGSTDSFGAKQPQQLPERRRRRMRKPQPRAGLHKSHDLQKGKETTQEQGTLSSGLSECATAWLNRRRMLLPPEKSRQAPDI